MANARIAELTDATVTMGLNWRGRYQRKGVAGLVDQPRPGARLGARDGRADGAAERELTQMVAGIDWDDV